MVDKSTNEIDFWKMHGAGNDFVLFDNRSKHIAHNATNWFQMICHRHDGIGAEGIILLENADDADFSMVFINPDGHKADMCGNGARCVARLAFDMDLAGHTMRIATDAGLVSAQINDDSVTIALPNPNKLRQGIQLSSDYPDADFIHTGVPHVVVFCDDIDVLAIQKDGKSIREHRFFTPSGTNVNFVKKVDQNTLRVRTYERGVEDETPACGTGLTAAALIAHLRLDMQPPISLQCMHGDILRVDFKCDEELFHQVTLTGPTQHCFRGIVQTPNAYEQSPKESKS